MVAVSPPNRAVLAALSIEGWAGALKCPAGYGGSRCDRVHEGESLVLGKLGTVPTTGEQLGRTEPAVSPWIWQLGDSGGPASLAQVKLSGRGQSSVVEGRRGQALAGRRGSTRILWVFAVVYVYLPLLNGIGSFGTEGATVSDGGGGPGSRKD